MRMRSRKKLMPQNMEFMGEDLVVGVTVSLYQTHLLGLVANNQKNLDQWVIICPDDDYGSQAFCRKHGIIWLPLQSVRNGEYMQFPALLQSIRAAVVPSTSQRESTRLWLSIFAPGLLLPHAFQKRIPPLRLDEAAVYRSSGVRWCSAVAEFASLKGLEPWTPSTIGREHRLEPFLIAADKTLEARLKSLKLENVSLLAAEGKSLPFSLLSLTDKCEAEVALEHAESCRSKALEPPQNQLPEQGSDNILAPIGLLYGVYPSVNFFGEFSGFGHLIAIDRWAIWEHSEVEATRIDRGTLRGLLSAEPLDTPISLARYTDEIFAQIPSESIDKVVIQGELGPGEFLDFLIKWLPKLKKGGVITLGSLGLPAFQMNTLIAASIFKNPFLVLPNGLWMTNISLRVLAIPPVEDVGGRAVLILVEFDKHEQTIVSLCRARKLWGGKIIILDRNRDNLSLKAVSIQLRIDYHEFKGNSIDYTSLVQICNIHGLGGPLFVIRAEYLLLSCFDDEVGGLIGNVSSVAKVLTISPSGIQTNAVYTQEASAYDDRLRVGVVDFSRGLVDANDEAYELWCEAEAEAAVLLRTSVRAKPEELTVLVFVDRDTMGEFQRNWLTWDFDGAQVVIAIIGLEESEVWIPQSEMCEFVYLNEGLGHDLVAALSLVRQKVRNGRLLIISPLISALPGSKVWVSSESRLIASHRSQLAHIERKLCGNEFISAVEFGSLPSKELGSLIAFCAGFQRKELFLAIHQWLESLGSMPEVIQNDMTTFCWQIPATFYLKLPKSFGVTRRPPPPLIEAETGTHNFGDVVVISMPKRVDRRARFVTMMQDSGFSYRFVEGVHVPAEQIAAAEVSQVTLRPFKLIAGFDKYKQGMVGCRRAHIREIRRAFEANLESLMIIEDDACFKSGWSSLLQNAIAELPEGWLQLYLSGWDAKRSESFSHHLRRLRGAHQTTAILYSRAGMYAALNTLEASRSEIDHWMCHHLHPFGLSFAVTPSITYQEGGVSDIMSFDRGRTA